MKSRSYFFSLFFSLILIDHIVAQDLPYARRIVDTLTSRSMYGRGYVMNSDLIDESARTFSGGIRFDSKIYCGLQNAATYISKEFNDIDLKNFEKNKDYFQPFKHNVNTFPSAIIFLDGKALSPGKDFIVLPNSKGFHNEAEIAWLTDSVIDNKKRRKEFLSIDYSQKVIIIDTIAENKSKKISASALLHQIKKPPGAFIYTTEKKFTWSVSQNENSITEILVSKNVINRANKKIAISIDNLLLNDFTSKNIIGYIEGKEKPDSFIVFSAHYDHLGAMGDAIFPGANDNASGCAMLLNLAKYYSENQPKYSIAFIAFAGEELGLLGSRYYTEHPLFPLSKIKFLVNMDIVGTGDEGMTVVNGSVYKEAFNSLTNINNEKGYLKQIKSRGKAANSDHYFFSEKGVPAFFIYTMGGIGAYHDILDRGETLPLTEFEDLFKLLTTFTDNLQGIKKL